MPQKPFSASETIRTVFSVHTWGKVESSVLEILVKELYFLAKMKVEEVEIEQP